MIDLTDFSAAFRDYMVNDLLVELLPVVPARGSKIGPGEEFAVKVRVTNSTPAEGIGLKNVRIRIWAVDPTIGKLRGPIAISGIRPPMSGSTSASLPTGVRAPSGSSSPTASPVGSSPLSSSGPPLGPLASEVIYTRSTVAAGEVVEINIDHCWADDAGGAPTYRGGTTNIDCQVTADVDLNALFPSGQASATAATALIVEG